MDYRVNHILTDMAALRRLHAGRRSILNLCRRIRVLSGQFDGRSHDDLTMRERNADVVLLKDVP